MKFLCVDCDQPMKLTEKSPPDRGSVSIVYRCESCGHKTAMLTNPFETQMVRSLGVRIGPEQQAGESKCPFTGMLSEMEQSSHADANDGAHASHSVSASHATEAGDQSDPQWTAGATERLERIPDFIRPMAKDSIEKFAKQQGISTIDESVLSQARAFFEM